MVGIDGGVNYREFKGYAIIVVDAEAIFLDEGKVMHEYRAGFADIIAPYWLPVERSRMYMNILELRLALKSLNHQNNTLILLDGSLSNMLPKVQSRYLPSFSETMMLYDKYINIFRESIEDGILDVVSRDISFDVFLSKKDEDIRMAQRLALYIEILEYMVCFSAVLNPRFSGRIISIAKNSSSRRLFRSNISDIGLLEYLTRGRGYLREGIITLAEKGGYLPLYNKVSRVPIAVYYARLEENGPVLRIEIPYEKSTKDSIKIISSLSSISAGGYPYPLRLAHEEVSVKDKDLEDIIRVMGIYATRTGREIL